MEITMDPRVKKLAQVLVQYSLKLKKGDYFKIQGEVASLPLIEAAYEEAIRVGAYPYVQVRVANCEEAFFRLGNDDQLSFISPLAKLEIDRIDAYLTIWGSSNTRYLAGIEPKRQALQRKSTRPIIQKMFARIAKKDMAWVGTQFPTLADAQEADMSLADYENFVYGAGHITSQDPVKH